MSSWPTRIPSVPARNVATMNAYFKIIFLTFLCRWQSLVGRWWYATMAVNLRGSDKVSWPKLSCQLNVMQQTLDLVFIAEHAETPTSILLKAGIPSIFKSKIHFPSSRSFSLIIGILTVFLLARKMIIQTFHIQSLIGDIILDWIIETNGQKPF